MKYAVICDPDTPQALASSTLFDLLGDPSTWKEHHEVRFIGDPDGTDKSWAGLVVEAGGFTVQDDFAGLDATWVILGPTEEELVVEGTATGAKYLALDEGLVELSVVDEPAKEAPVVPDVPEDAAPEVEPPAEPATEVPATPKRRASRKKAAPAPAKVEEKPVPVEEPKIDTKKPLTVESVRAAGQDIYSDITMHENPTFPKKATPAELQSAFEDAAEEYDITTRHVSVVLRELIGVLIEGADEEQLWQIAAAIRGLIK